MGRFFNPSPAGGGSGASAPGVGETSTDTTSATPPGALSRATLPFQGRDKLTWLALEPLTGRTHQLRVHCAEMGFPIVGDTIYGTASRNSVSLGGPALHLHAREVVVPISKNKPPVKVTAPVPPHMRELLAQVRVD